MAKNIHNCPVCESTQLEPSTLADGLEAWACPACNGNWVKGAKYFDWLKSDAASREPDADAQLAPTATSDSKAGKFCIDCGRHMRRVAVGHGKPFHLDRCTSCGGFWFDANEWAALQSAGLHRAAHQVFTDSWQAEVRRQSREAADQSRLPQRLGVDGVAQLESLKQWITEHPRGNEILAALTDTADQ